MGVSPLSENSFGPLSPGSDPTTHVVATKSSPGTLITNSPVASTLAKVGYSFLHMKTIMVGGP
jgi:hypothetical protein